MHNEAVPGARVGSKGMGRAIPLRYAINWTARDMWSGSTRKVLLERYEVFT